MLDGQAKRFGQLFFDAKMCLPRRVVVHKRTPFTTDEQRGLLQGLEGVENVELIEVTIEESLRYLASRMTTNGKPEIDKFPIPRGAVVLLNKTSALLWVHGVTPNAIIPNWKYYQGKRRIPTAVAHSPLSRAIGCGSGSERDPRLIEDELEHVRLLLPLAATLDSASAIAKGGHLPEWIRLSAVRLPAPHLTDINTYDLS
jgi:hypothetical protein